MSKSFICLILSFCLGPTASVLGSSGLPGPADMQFFGDFYLPLEKKLDDYHSAKRFRALSRSSRLNIANLEGSISPQYMPPTFKRFLLRMDQTAIDTLSELRIDAVTLANNHAMDFGLFGLLTTTDALEKAHIRYQGAGVNEAAALTPMIIPLRDVTLCVLSFSRTFPEQHWAKEHSAGVASPSFIRTAEEVKKCVDRGYFTAAVFHWGEENKKSAKAYQKDLAHLMIDQGAKLVIGHHSHFVQEVEIYKDVPIFYSLGNFVFGKYEMEAPYQDGGAARLFLEGTDSIQAFEFALFPTAKLSELNRVKPKSKSFSCDVISTDRLMICKKKPQVKTAAKS